MVSQRSFQRRLRTFALAATVAVPAVGVTTIEAGAHATPKPAVHGERDDLNMVRVATNAARVKLRLAKQRAAAKAAAVPPSPEQVARASRSLVRTALTRNVYVRPVPGPVTQWYGSHPGIDIAPAYGTPVSAAHAGVVTFVGWDDGYGMHVEVAQIDGYVTTYSHLSGYAVKVGQLVVAGQWVGAVGSTGWSTGPHLHFEVHLPGGARTDPAAWLREHRVKI